MLNMSDVEFLRNDLLRELREEFAKVESWLRIQDPDSTPFASKYKARESLEAMIEKLSPFVLEGVHGQALSAALYTKLGCIDIEVEEFSSGERDLMKALDLFRLVDDKAWTIISEVGAFNQLGILWCMRTEHEKAKVYLESALQLYLDFPKNSETIIYDLNDLLDPNQCTPFCEKEKPLELLNTYSYYYLAQVYEKTGDRDKSAEYCHITLRKQLEMKEYQAQDWITNACMLSQYYIVNDAFGAAKRHLAAALFILNKYEEELSSREMDEEDKAEIEEKLKKLKADVQRSWGKYCLVLLQKSQERMMMHPEEEEELNVVDIENEMESSSSSADFSGVELDSKLMTIPEKFAKNFEEAREIFLPGQRFYNSAKTDFYILNDWCTDYTEITRDLSQMLKVLAFFEEDSDRRFKMHKKRSDLLNEVAEALSPSVYLLICRQLRFELGEIYSAMMDAKMDKIKTAINPTPNLVLKVNALIKKSCEQFMHFLDSLKDTEGNMPSTFTKETTRPALIAYFHLGRLFDKYIVPERSPDKLKNKVQTYCYYKEIVDYCEAHPEAVELMDGELEICQEMVQLLPLKIDRMRQELQQS